jgi:hypothetical protein
MVVAITTRGRIMRRGLYVLLGVLLVPTVGLVGDIVTDGGFKSTMSTGAPLEVASAEMVANLNADMVDGVEGTDLYTRAEVDSLVAAAVAEASPREYYLSSTSVAGDGAESACGGGFHMAALYEIANPSNLKYASTHPDAVTWGDSGTGPPTGVWGWIRTGYIDASSGENLPGTANCLGWTSNSEAEFGTGVILPIEWSDPIQSSRVLVWGTPWAAVPHGCDAPRGVWCVED